MVLPSPHPPCTLAHCGPGSAIPLSSNTLCIAPHRPSPFPYPLNYLRCVFSLHLLWAYSWHIAFGVGPTFLSAYGIRVLQLASQCETFTPFNTRCLWCMYSCSRTLFDLSSFAVNFIDVLVQRGLWFPRILQGGTGGCSVQVQTSPNIGWIHDAQSTLSRTMYVPRSFHTCCRLVTFVIPSCF